MQNVGGIQREYRNCGSPQRSFNMTALNFTAKIWLKFGTRHEFGREIAKCFSSIWNRDSLRAFKFKTHPCIINMQIRVLM